MRGYERSTTTRRQWTDLNDGQGKTRACVKQCRRNNARWIRTERGVTMWTMNGQLERGREKGLSICLYNSTRKLYVERGRRKRRRLTARGGLRLEKRDILFFFILTIPEEMDWRLLRVSELVNLASFRTDFTSFYKRDGHGLTMWERARATMSSGHCWRRQCRWNCWRTKRSYDDVARGCSPSHVKLCTRRVAISIPRTIIIVLHPLLRSFIAHVTSSNYQRQPLIECRSGHHAVVNRNLYKHFPEYIYPVMCRY